MKTTKVLVVCGTRPEAIKMAPVFLELRRRTEQFDARLCVTGQHREMLDQVLEAFAIKPHYDLNLMKANQSLHQLTSDVLLGMDKVLSDFAPEVVLVQGDTTTCLAAALASFYRRIPVGHIEAGLRTSNLYSPWPEEGNRQLVSRIATYHFPPTEESERLLRSEGLASPKILRTGNTVIDALYSVISRIQADPTQETGLRETLQRLTGYRLSDRKFILVTGHRRENFGEGIAQVCRGLRMVAEAHPEIDVIYPVHLNPNIQKPVRDLLAGLENVFLPAPLEYVPFVYLMSRAHLIVTDSGGIQEEAPSLKKPVLLTRDTTERPEAVKTGAVRIVGPKADRIFEGVDELLKDSQAYARMTSGENPYGDGRASQRIADYLAKEMNAGR